MISSYFKTTLRHFAKSRINFGFRLGGLAVALFSFFVIALYISYQLSFDQFHTEYQNLYRVNGVREENGQLQSYGVVPPALGPALKASFSEISATARIGIPGSQLVRYKTTLLRPNGFVEVDSTVFDVFTFQFKQGDRHALDGPESIVLTESMAKQIFGDDDPFGKPLVFTERFGRILTVTAIVRDFPPNGHLDIRAMMGRNALTDDDEKIENRSWNINAITNLYVRLHPGALAWDFGDKVTPLLRKNMPKEQDGSEQKFTVFLQPVKEIYFGKPMKMEFGRKGDINYVYAFAILGLALLIIATINYLNLSVADLSIRAKEMSIRKVLGAAGSQISLQVAFEVLILCAGALVISLTALYLIFPKVQQLLEANLRYDMLLDRRIILLTVFVFIALLTGSSVAPALFHSRSTAARDLGTGQSLVKNSAGKTLLLVQLFISIFCICATWVVSRQVDFIRQTDIGYDRNKVVALLMPDRYPGEKAPALKAGLERLAGVESVSFSYYLISGAPYLKDCYRIEVDGEMKPLMLNEVFVDHDFISTLNIPLIEGRNFDVSNPADVKSAFIVNESAVEEFGWDNAVGKRISIGHDVEAGEWQGAVVGVVKDFNIRPLREKIEPLVMRLQYDNWPGYWLNIKVNGPVDETVASIKATYENILPGFLADYRLMEDVYNRQYQNEAKAYTALRFGTWVIVTISAIGIFSLSLYQSIRRMKEFGIRKVLGASVGQIALLHAGNFVQIATLANLLALPIAWWMMSSWLNGFAYRVNTGPLLYGGVMALSLALLLLSVGYSAWRSARMNPVDVIKAQ